MFVCHFETIYYTSMFNWHGLHSSISNSPFRSQTHKYYFFLILTILASLVHKLILSYGNDLNHFSPLFSTWITDEKFLLPLPYNPGEGGGQIKTVVPSNIKPLPISGHSSTTFHSSLYGECISIFKMKHCKIVYDFN